MSERTSFPRVDIVSKMSRINREHFTSEMERDVTLYYSPICKGSGHRKGDFKKKKTRYQIHFLVRRLEPIDS